MVNRTVVILAISVLFISMPAQAQEKYTIKVKEAGQGDSYLSKEFESKKDNTKVLDGQGKSLKDDNETSSRSMIYTVTCLENMGLRWAYEKAVITENEKTRILAAEGKTVLIEKKGDKYQFRFEGGPELRPELAKDLELDEDFKTPDDKTSIQNAMPKKPVQLNEPWSIDPLETILKAPSAKEGTKMLDLAKAKFTGKLVRVYLKNKTQYGVVEFDGELPVKAGVEIQKGVKLTGGKFAFKAAFEGCIDGSVFSRTTIVTQSVQLQAMVEIDGRNAMVVWETSGKVERSRQDLPKK